MAHQLSHPLGLVAVYLMARPTMPEGEDMVPGTII